MRLRRSKIRKIKNVDSPFTELLSLLKKYQALADGLTALAYEDDQLIVMHQHAENTIEVLLQGLQCLGQVVDMSVQRKVMNIQDVSAIGALIAISNLTESLTILKSDTNYELRKRGLDGF